MKLVLTIALCGVALSACAADQRLADARHGCRGVGALPGSRFQSPCGNGWADPGQVGYENGATPP